MPKQSVLNDSCTVIESIATANPPYSVKQSDASEFMLRTPGISESLRKRIPRVYENSAIEQRFTCLADYTRTPDEFEFYPKSATLLPSPSTGARNMVYQRESVPLALQAAAECLKQANTTPREVTHVIVVSCTGFFAPGIDILLVKRLGLPLNTHRTVIGFMGCYAALNGLKAADAICKSFPDANVLLVCVELCTLHFQIENSLESVIVNALFSDGCAACLLRQIPESKAAGKLIYLDAETLMDDDSLDAMSWSIGDTGFTMGLSPKVPEIISKNLPGFVDSLTKRNNLSIADLDFWAVHPGGRQVLDRTAAVMDLKPEAIIDSYDVLKNYGNMSSPTILFILKQIMEKQSTARSRYGIAAAFGPGLTIEGCLLEFGT
jgi:predicted naringenin-chalcone synthase